MCILPDRNTSYQAIWLHYLFLLEFLKVVWVCDWFNFEVVVDFMLISVVVDLILLLELRGCVLVLKLFLLVIFIQRLWILQETCVSDGQTAQEIHGGRRLLTVGFEFGC